MASSLHWGKPEQWGVTPIDIVITAKNRGHKMVKRSRSIYSCWSRTKFGLGHAVKMQLMIVEIIIFSTCIVKWSRAFCGLVIKIMVLAVSTVLVGVISGGSLLICASNHCIMGKFCWVLNNRSQQVGGLVLHSYNAYQVPTLLRLAPKCIEFLIWLIV